MEKMEKTGHFWYSEKSWQGKISSKNDGYEGDHKFRNFAQIHLSGDVPFKIVEYTEWTQDLNPITKFDDLKYLGYGEYHHSEPIQ